MSENFNTKFAAAVFGVLIGYLFWFVSDWLRTKHRQNVSERRQNLIRDGFNVCSRCSNWWAKDAEQLLIHEANCGGKSPPWSGPHTD